MATDRLEQLITKLNKNWQRDAKKAIKYFQKLLAEGVKVDAAIDKVQKHYLGLFTLPELRSALVEAAAYAYGIVPSVLTTAQVELMGDELSRAWDASGMKLSEKLHGAEQKMRKAIIDTVQEQMRQNRTWQQAARALYDGYMGGENVYTGGSDIIRRQDMARYMQAVRHATDGSPLALRQQAQALERINALARRGAPNKALQAAYNELLEMVQLGEDEQIARAAAVAINEKSRYVAERITRTEMARAWADGFWAKVQADSDIVAVKYKLSSRHPVFDICDMYAKADMFGLGAGVYPKDKVPALPVHPHCLCRYVEVIHGEVDMDKQHEQVRAAGDKWLNELLEQRRAQVLGRAGAEAWEDGADWRKYMRGFSGFREAESRLSEVQGRGRKTEITQKTIDEIGEFAFPTFNKRENQIMLELHKKLLLEAEKNNNNEVAFIVNSNLKHIYTIKGHENGVDINTSADSLLRRNNNIQILHNHPFGYSFSTRDIALLLEYDNIKGLSLITNSGHIETLQKTDAYDRITAGKIMFDVMSDIENYEHLSKNQVATKLLLMLIKGGHITWKM